MIIYWRDPLFWAALVAGPLCWMIMFWVGVPLRESPASLKSMAYLVVAYPLLEEIVFRGGIQPALSTRPILARSAAGISIANVITSALFAVAHLLNQSILWSSLVFIPSLVFGWARDRHNTIVSPIILHMSYNAGFLWLFAAS
ncbi:MAG: JDVT-CTERM system glutamic-type intramembrane protease [Granulosicoccus sp.]